MEFIKSRLTRKEAADYIGVSPQTLANWACTGRESIPFYKIGKKKVIYHKVDLDTYLSSARQNQTA
ncbi:TPA: helix-turn-helix domain-containing protein [Yersinia enterocolitica]|nr:DNA-binding protein [Yersinia enterocolitica]HDL6507908.1 helix-turn-helix domain-containing protein [Yersinia enterocolitica]HDL8432779.1 helix-turn-helix domain-containing protein [Yersinia enterocolitica]HDL8511571.1 helix-turn-helix domain-containing protein [Yersinia enterocolitica]HDO7714041.1 helix-turn-helix domain-containing protein [Yersinia enterocolitica]